MAVDPFVLKALEAILGGASAELQESETLDFKIESARSRADTERRRARPRHPR
jgi:hypothetical protein